jgi:hypothetical protein
MLPLDAAWPPEGEQEQEHVLWWSEEQVKSLQGNLAAYRDAKGIRDEVNLAVRVINSLIGPAVRKAYKERGDLQKLSKVDDEIEKAARGAFVSILSRSFQQADTATEETRLVPLLDMLQHSSEPNVRPRAKIDENGDQVVIAMARRRIEEGEELVQSYDSDRLESWQFLTRFGFVPGVSVSDFIASITEENGMVRKVAL